MTWPLICNENGLVPQLTGADWPGGSCCCCRRKPGGRDSCSAEGSGRGRGRERGRTCPAAFVSARHVLQAELWAPRSPRRAARASSSPHWLGFEERSAGRRLVLEGWPGQAADEDKDPQRPSELKPRGASPPQIQWLPGWLFHPSGCQNVLHDKLE